jgi:peptidoglycan hydrolase-like protein with peptidoglycan-binding domain
VKRRGTKILGAILGVAVIAGAGAAAVVWKPWAAHSEQSAASVPAPNTVPVERTTLTKALMLNAELTYGKPQPVPDVSGLLTALPAPDARIKVGEQIYELDGRPIFMFQGARPLWRDVAPDMTDGEDVKEVEENLKTLGFFKKTPDLKFDAATAKAITAWQKDKGLDKTGTIAAGQVLMVNAPSLRVAQLTAQVGDRDKSPLTYTATTLHAVAKLTEAQSREFKTGTPVTVRLADGTEVASTLGAIDPGGQPTGDDDGSTTPPTVTGEFPDQAPVQKVGQSIARVVIDDPEGEGEATLVVPVSALLATADGEYAVEVAKGATIVRIPVQIGKVVDARAQVAASGPAVAGPAGGPELTEGDKVVIAK